MNNEVGSLGPWPGWAIPLALLVSVPSAGSGAVSAAPLESQSDWVVVQPEEYPDALRNPHKGFTNRGFREDNRWATLVHHYIPWNQIESDESDDIDKIRSRCDTAWQDLPGRNQKVIPRVYLHWSGDRKYWPADMKPDDYSSEQFQQRVTRLVERLGVCWNQDPRVAHVELGIIGKWGEHHSPSPTPEVEALLGNAFARAFPNKQVLVRHPWREFQGHGFGGYWDSWAHTDQMNSHGKGLASLGDLWQTSLIGGETAYDWGRFREQPGDNPTDTVTDPQHREFLIDTIRSLHGTQLRWVSDYDENTPETRAGATEVQKALGYRYVIKEVRYPRQLEPGQTFQVGFEVVNTGSAPFYYHWPVELSLLDPKSGEPVWRQVFEDTDLRDWLPGDGWNIQSRSYAQPPALHRVTGSFTLNPSVPSGAYVIALAILDPAGEVPALRFAIRNYQRGGRHPIGRIGVSQTIEAVGLVPKEFTDPSTDESLHYVP